VVAELPGQLGVLEAGQEAGRAVEVGHLQVGGAHPGRVVRVRARARGQAEPGGQVRRLLVQRLVGDLGVEHLDDVHRACRAQARKHPAEAGPGQVERVRHVDQCPLRSDPADDLGQRQHVGDPLGQEQPDHVAVGRPDLLAHEDPDAQVALGCQDGSRGDVVVGDADHVQAGLPGPLGQLIEGQHGVAGRDRVQVAVDPDPSGRGHETHPRSSLAWVDTATAAVENISRTTF
jgi:hypothetical protein